MNTAKFVMDRLIEHGKVSRGFLGVAPTDLTPKSAERYGVKKGVLVLTVDVDTAADKAGMQVEDVIVEFDGKAVENEIQFRDLVATSVPGKTVDIVVVRDKKRVTLKATLAEAPGLVSEKPAEEVTGKLGFSVEQLTPDLAGKHGLDSTVTGVVITKVNPTSRVARAGLQAGSVIRAVNSRPIETVADFNAAVKDVKSGDTLYLRLETKQRTMLIEVPVE